MTVYKRALRIFDAASLTANFQDMGAQVTFASLKVAITNTSDVDVLITDQSTQDDIRVPSGGTLSLGEGLSNDNGTSTKVTFQANITLQVKQVTASGTGTIIVQLFG